MINPGQENTPTLETPAPPPKPWGGWATIGLGAAVLALYFIAQSVVALVFVFWRIFSNPDIDIVQSVTNLTSDGLLISLAIIFSAIVGIGFILLFVKVRKGIRFSKYLELNPLSGKTILILVLVFGILLAISLVLSIFWSQLEDPGFTVDAFNTSVWPGLFGVAVVIFAPLFEETFFRGFLFKGLKESALGVVGTILLTSLLWALLHLQYDISGMAQIFVLGLVFGAVRLKTNSLWASLSLHAFWNLAALISAAIIAKG